MSEQTETQPSRWKRGHKIALAIVLGLIVIIVASTCGADTETAAPPAETTSAPAPKAEEAPPACVTATDTDLLALRDGLEKGSNAKPKSGSMVFLSDAPDGYDRILAVTLAGEKRIATFAFKGDNGIIYVNKTADKHYTWGDAMNPGSPKDIVRQGIAGSAEHAAVIKCEKSVPEPSKVEEPTKEPAWAPDAEVDWENHADSVKKSIDKNGKQKDCEALQEAFDRADANDTAQRNRTGDGNADLMEYIDQWLEHAGCYR